MPAGRPTSYKPEYCDQVIEWGALGKSLVWMAASFGVSRDTVHEWSKVHPEFSDALTRARALSQQWWEDAGQSALGMPGFSAALWAKNISCRFREDWTDNSKTEITGANGGPVQIQRIERVVIDPKKAE